MKSCPRCLKGKLFYDQLDREWACIACSYRPLPVAAWQYEMVLPEWRSRRYEPHHVIGGKAT